VLYNLIINIVVSMLEIGTHTKTLLLCLILSFKNIMESVQLPNILLIWMYQKLLEILLMMHQFILLELELVAQLMDLDFLLELQSSRDLE